MLPLASDIRHGKVWALTDAGRDAARQLLLDAAPDDPAAKVLGMLEKRPLSAAYLAWARFAWAEYHMTQRPLFFFGLLAMILGTQFFLAGFLAEMISRNAQDRNNYLIEEKTGFTA